MKKFEEFLNENKPAAAFIGDKFDSMLDDMNDDFDTLIGYLENLKMSGAIDDSKFVKINAKLKSSYSSFKELQKYKHPYF